MLTTSSAKAVKGRYFLRFSAGCRNRRTLPHRCFAGEKDQRAPPKTGDTAALAASSTPTQLVNWVWVDFGFCMAWRGCVGQKKGRFFSTLFRKKENFQLFGLVLLSGLQIFFVFSSPGCLETEKQIKTLNTENLKIYLWRI